MHVQDASGLLPRTVIPEKAGQGGKEFPALGFWATEDGLKHPPHERVRLVGRPRSEVWRGLGVPNVSDGSFLGDVEGPVGLLFRLTDAYRAAQRVRVSG